MDIISAYREAGTYRGAAQIAGTTHKTVKRVIARHEAGGAAPERVPRGRNYDGVAVLGRGAGGEDVGADLGQAAAARGPGCGVCGVAAELPAPGGGGEAGLAARSITGAAARRCGRRVSTW